MVEIMRGILLLIAVFGVTIASDCNASDTIITKENWNTHPKILYIREMVSSIDKNIKENKYSQKIKEQNDYLPVIKKILYFDENNIVRKYKMETGSEDSFSTISIYYNQQKELIFIYITRSSTNQSSIEYRTYFNDGKSIWEMVSKTGQGWGWPDKMQKEDIIIDPLKDFNK